MNKESSDIIEKNKDKITSNLVLSNEVVYEFNNSLVTPENSEKKLEQSMSSSNLDNSSYFSNTSQLNEELQKSNYSNFDSSANHVVSEKVQNLAAQIYNELQKIISTLNDDDEVVSGLMPLIVNVLESLDLQLIETQQLQVEIELLKDDNDQLNTAFEKEKQIKKKLEKQLLEFEFNSEEEKQRLEQKINSLENIVKMLEIKSKNSNDTVTRLEEEKIELKNEFNKLHHRNNDLLRSYCDLMERVKILVGCEENANISNLNNLDWQLFNKLKKNTEFIESNEKNCSEKATDRIQENFDENLNVTNKTNLKSNYNLNELMTMEDDQSLNDVSLIDDSNKDCQSLTGQLVNPGEYASTTTDNLFGMEKEIENLISENNELLTTKNALNIVKNDLILQIDDLQSQNALLQQENLQIIKIQDFYKQKIEKLEDELKKSQNQTEQLKIKINQNMKDFEEGVPIAQRKRFTRSEMARAIMEKNEYKKRFIELQESIKYTDEVRNRIENQERKSYIWKFFSNFFSNTSASENSSLNDFSNVRYQNSNVDINFNQDSSYRNSNLPALESMRRRVKQSQNKSLHTNDNTNNDNNLVVFFDNDLKYEKKKMNRKSQINNNIVAYGWCLQQNFQENSLSTHPVPVPIHCRPLATTVTPNLANSTNLNSINQNSNGLRIWCAAAVDLSGGEAGFPHSNSECCVKKDTEQPFLPETPSDVSEEVKQIPFEYKLSTFTWICSVSHSKSKITIVNMKSNPSEILDTFFVKTHLFCICSVSGAKNSDSGVNIEFENDNGPILFKVKKEIKIKSTSLDNQKLSSSEHEDKKESPTANLENKNEKNFAFEKLANYLDYYKDNDKLNDKKTSFIDKDENYIEKMTTVLPTMWLGGQNGRIYVYSSVAQWSQLIDYVDLNDSVLNINYSSGKIFAGLANGEICIFTRDYNNGDWKLHEYYLINLNEISYLFYNNYLIDYEQFSASPNEYYTKKLFEIQNDVNKPIKNDKSNKNGFSIRCSTIADHFLWCGYRNLVIVFSIDNLNLLHIDATHSNKEEQVRQLTTISYLNKNANNEMFILCILRLDCVLRIYQNQQPFNCIYNIDLEPTINKFLICNLSKHKQLEEGLSDGSENKMLGLINFIRITSVKVTENRIWLGTANGVILTIPHLLKIENGNASPKLVLENCQLSFHGHKDAVKFFVAAKNLVLSGGEGYTDFRIESELDSGISNILTRTDKSYLILWEINN